MSKFICGVVVAAASVVIGIAGAAVPPAAASPDCMTQDEARKAFPRDHLYWHGPQKCWDNVGKHRTPAADVKPASDAAQSAPSQAVKPGKPTAAQSRASGSAPAVPFISDDPSRVISWAALAAPQRVQQDNRSPSSAAAAGADEEGVAIGAPYAAPGSPDDLLEHCCWPPAAAAAAAASKREDTLLPRMVVASAGACGLAVGLWLFVYRRRPPARVRWS